NLFKIRSWFFMSTYAKSKLGNGPKMSKGLKIWLAFILIITAIGGYFIIESLIVGLDTTNFSSITPWGAWFAFYIFFFGLSAGSFLLFLLIIFFCFYHFY